MSADDAALGALAQATPLGRLWWRGWLGRWRFHCDRLQPDRVAQLLWALRQPPRELRLVHLVGIVLAQFLIYAATPNHVEHNGQ